MEAERQAGKVVEREEEGGREGAWRMVRGMEGGVAQAWHGSATFLAPSATAQAPSSTFQAVSSTQAKVLLRHYDTVPAR